MGLHRLAHDRSDDHYRDVWDAWSAQFDGYDREANENTWESLKADGNETGALGRNGIIELAETFGFERPPEQTPATSAANQKIALCFAITSAWRPWRAISTCRRT